MFSAVLIFLPLALSFVVGCYLAFNKLVYRLIFTLILIILFQSPYILLLINLNGGRVEETFKLILALKDSFVIGSLIGVYLNIVFSRLLRRTSPYQLSLSITWFKSIQIAVFLYVILVAIINLQSGDEFHSILVGLRSLLMLPILLVLGQFLATAQVATAQSLKKFIVYPALLLAVVCIFESIFLSTSLMRDLRIDKFGYVRMLDSQMIPFDGWPGNYVFWDFGRPVIRSGSLMMDPLITSFAITSGICAILVKFIEKTKSGSPLDIIILLILSVGISTTISRGGLLTCFFAIMLFVFLRYAWKPKLPFLVAGYVGACLFIAILGPILLSKFSGETHVNGLTLGFSEGFSNPLGVGLGQSGNMATGLSATAEEGEKVGEIEDSFAGSLCAQIGVIGLAIYSIYIISVSAHLLSNNFLDPEMRLISISIGVFIYTCYVVAVVSESSTSFSGVGISFLLAGYLLKNSALAKVRMASPTPLAAF